MIFLTLRVENIANYFPGASEKGVSGYLHPWGF